MEGRGQSRAVSDSGQKEQDRGLVTEKLVSSRIPSTQLHQPRFLLEISLVLGKSWGYFGFI